MKSSLTLTSFAACSLGTIPLTSPLWYYNVLLHILGTSALNSNGAVRISWFSPPQFFSRFETHRQLMSSLMTRFDSWLIMRASTSWCSANRGTSQNACALFASYAVFAFSGEYQGGTVSTRSRSCRISKKSIFRAALCRVTYLFYARAAQPLDFFKTLFNHHDKFKWHRASFKNSKAWEKLK